MAGLGAFLYLAASQLIVSRHIGNITPVNLKGQKSYS